MAWKPPPRIEYRDWLLEGRRIGVFSRSSQWWVGDWLVYGTGRWGEMYSEAARVTGYDAKSLRNMRYVASRIDVSLRKDNLTFGHHALVASLDGDQQRYWLVRATEDRLSVEDLRIELRAIRRAGGSESRTGDQALDGHQTVVLCPSCGDPVPIPARLLS